MPSDTLSLAGKVAIVSGSGRGNGIGAGIAFALARNRARNRAAVTINYFSSPQHRVLKKLRRKSGTQAVRLLLSGHPLTKKGQRSLSRVLSRVLRRTTLIFWSINISSTAARMPLAAYNVYGASKVALDYLTAVWAGEFGKSRGITVNSIGPGLVETDIIPDDPEFRKIAVDPMLDLTRAARQVGTIEDIGDSVLLIVSEKARWITAQHVSACGGVTAL